MERGHIVEDVDFDVDEVVVARSSPHMGTGLEVGGTLWNNDVGEHVACALMEGRVVAWWNSAGEGAGVVDGDSAHMDRTFVVVVEGEVLAMPGLDMAHMVAEHHGVLRGQLKGVAYEMAEACVVLVGDDG